MKPRLRVPLRPPKNEEISAHQGVQPWAVRHARAIALSLGLALVLGLAAAYYWQSGQPAEGVHLQSSLPQTSSPDPSIQLPDQPAEAAAEQLRSELDDLASGLLADFSEVPEALHVVALLYADLRRTTEAAAIWKKCIPLAPQQPGPYIGLATAQMDLGNNGAAVATLQQAQAAGCSTSDLYHQLAAAMTKLGRLDEAAKVSRQGLKIFPRSPESWLQLGQVQIQLGQFEAAEASLLRAKDLGLTSDAVYFALATTSARQGKTAEAAQYRERFDAQQGAQASRPDQEFEDRYNTEMRRIAVASLCRAGSVYRQQDQLAEAERLLWRACELAPRSSAVCTELATMYRRAGRIADARLVVERLVAIEPQVVPHYVNLASLSAQLGDKGLAESTFKQVIGMRPDLSIGYAGLARLYLNSGQAEQARWFAEAALQQQPTAPGETAETYLVLSAACDQLNDRPAAAKALAQAQKLAPSVP